MVDRICLLIPSLTTGGAERQFTYLAQDLTPEFDVHVVTFSEEDCHNRRVLTRHPDVRMHTVERKGGYDAGVVWRLSRLFSYLSPDVLQCFLRIANVSGTLAAAYVGVPVRVIGLRSTFRENNLYRTVYYYLTCVVTNNLASGAVCNSYEGRRYHGANGFLRQKLCFIPNGIDVEQIQRKAHVKIPSGISLKKTNFQIGVFARFHPMKGLLQLLEAVEMIPDKYSFHLYLVGDGNDPYRTYVVRKAKQLPERVTLTGSLDNPYPLMEEMDLVVSSSLYGEGMSNSIMEAMALGVPVVSTDVGDATRLIEEGIHGRIVEPGSAQSMAEAICSVIRGKLDLRQARHQSPKRIRNLFPRDRMVTRYIQLYRSLFEKESGSNTRRTREER